MPTTVRIATSAEKDVIQNIDQFYLYEFARFMPAFYKLGDDGLFHDEDYLPYWEDPGKFPYLILQDDELAGFALVEDKGSERLMAQFFVLYKFQGKGVAKQAATKIFDLHPGKWTVQSLLNNPKSEGFWPRIIANYTFGTYEVKLQEPRKTHNEYKFIA